MRRSLAFLLIGAVGGGILTHYLVTDSAAPFDARDGSWQDAFPARSSQPTAVSASSSAFEDRGAAAAGAEPTADGRALVQALMAQTDGSLLEYMVREAAGSPGDEAAFVVQLLLVRYGEIDPLAAMDLALEVSPAIGVVLPIFQNLVRTDPDRALRNVDAWSGRLREGLGRLAGPNTGRQLLLQTGLRELANQDPQRAVAYVESMPPGPERQQMLNNVAEGYGRANPDAALAWARNARPADSNLLAAVIGGIAAEDPHRALDVALDLSAPMQREQALQTIIMRSALGGLGEPGQLATIANRLADAGPTGRSGVQQLVSLWGSRDPQSALEWLLVNEGRVDAHVYRNVGNALARSDPGAAAAYLQRLPDAVRPEWIGAVAQGYAERDVQQALRWLDLYRDESGYARAAAGVAQSLASRDPAAAAGVLDGIAGGPGATGVGAVLAVASQWARQDPLAAARWALRQDNAERAPALSNVVQTWSAHDPDGARSWTMGLTSSDERDLALLALVNATAATETPDARVLSAFSNDRARQQAVVASLPMVAQRDPDEARALIDAYVTDPGLRGQAEQRLSSGTSGALFRPGVNVSGHAIRGVAPSFEIQRSLESSDQAR